MFLCPWFLKNNVIVAGPGPDPMFLVIALQECKSSPAELTEWVRLSSSKYDLTLHSSHSIIRTMSTIIEHDNDIVIVAMTTSL